MGVGTPTKLGTLLAPLKAGALLGNRHLPALSTALTHFLSLSLAAVPVPECSPAGQPGGTLVSPPPLMGIAVLGRYQAQVYGAVLLGTLLGSGGRELPQSFLGGCQSLARLVVPWADGMGYDVLVLGVVLLHLGVSQACHGLLLSIAVPPHRWGTDFAPPQEPNAESGAWRGHLCSPFLAGHLAQLWPVSLLLCDQAMGGCG